MKTYAQLGRAALVTAALAIVGATASVAHDPNQDIARLQREVEDLRTEKNALQDQNIELARRFDNEKRLLQLQLDRAQKRLAHLEATASPLDARVVTVNFPDTTLEDAMSFMKDIAGLTVHSEGIEGLKVSLRARDVKLRTAVDLLVGNAKNEAGEWVELTWIQEDDGAISIRPR